MIFKLEKNAEYWLQNELNFVGIFPVLRILVFFFHFPWITLEQKLRFHRTSKREKKKLYHT